MDQFSILSGWHWARKSSNTAHHILGPSLPNSTLLSNFLLLTFHTIVDFCTHTHPPFVNCHQLRICPMPMGHHHPPSTGFSTSSPSISCGPCYPCHMPAPLWPGVSSTLRLGRSFGGVGWWTGGVMVVWQVGVVPCSMPKFFFSSILD